jgi:hypothetical protein
MPPRVKRERGMNREMLQFRRPMRIAVQRKNWVTPETTARRREDSKTVLEGPGKRVLLL